jgi:PEP-CTERM motif
MNVSMKKLAVALAVASTLAVGTAANANTVITFDDLPLNTIGIPIANGYAGLNWSNFYVVDGLTIYGGTTGWTAGVVSPPNVAFNAKADPASFSSGTAFSLVSMDVTKAWYAGITHFDGYVGNALTYTMDVSSTTTGPTLATFNWTGLNQVTMSDGNGTLHTVIDNLTISSVPEPETYGMMLAGLGLVGFISRRRKTA